jgi:hypothetical protein
VRAYAIGMGVDISRHRPGARNDYAAGARKRFARRCQRRLDEALTAQRSIGARSVCPENDVIREAEHPAHAAPEQIHLPKAARDSITSNGRNATLDSDLPGLCRQRRDAIRDHAMFECGGYHGLHFVARA